MYEHDIISSSSLKHGDKLVLESGPPLKPGQLMIRYYVRSASHSRQEMEVVVDKTITAQEVSGVLSCLFLPNMFAGVLSHLPLYCDTSGFA